MRIRCCVTWASLSLLLHAEVRWGGGGTPNSVSAAQGLPSSLDNATLVWEMRIGTHQYAIPTIDRGLVFLGLNDEGVMREGYQPNGGGAVRCAELATGKLLWELPVPRYTQGTQAPYYFDHWRCGICSGPVVVGDRVYVVGNRGDVLCLARHGQANGNTGPFQDEVTYMELAAAYARPLPTDGDIIWRFDMLKACAVIPHDTCGSTILYVNGLLYVCTSNGVNREHKVALSPDAPSLIVLDAETGRLVARDREDIGKNLFHGNWSSPSYGEVNGKGLIFFGGGDGFVYAFHALEGGGGEQIASPEPQTLKRVWRTDANPTHFRIKADGDGIPYAIPYTLWSNKQAFGPSEPIGTPVFHDGKVYVAIGQSPVHGLGDGCVSCFDAATGDVIWRSEKINRSLATAAIADGILYLPDEAATLHAFDAATGETLWTHDLKTTVYYANALVADGKVYIGTEKCDFWILKAGREKEVLSYARLPSPPITLAAADGYLLLPLQNRLQVYRPNK
ncbi:MAG: PQQ-binding-like beta-propeller repeat protein [Kiritimatiellaeota bacterium]|nr:PQQ-binding-like beta-propeller repeat protein [Kiritimatiellota bacterium]